jgi:hypothetical protein
MKGRAFNLAFGLAILVWFCVFPAFSHAQVDPAPQQGTEESLQQVPPPEPVVSAAAPAANIFEDVKQIVPNSMFPELEMVCDVLIAHAFRLSRVVSYERETKLFARSPATSAYCRCVPSIR